MAVFLGGVIVGVILCWVITAFVRDRALDATGGPYRPRGGQ